MRRAAAAVGALVVAALLLFPLGRSDFWLQLATIVLVYAVAAAGLDLIYGYTGMLSLGHAAFFGAGAYVTALLDRHTGLPVLVAMLLGILAAAAGGWLVGAVGLRVPGAYFALITLAAAFIVDSLVTGATFTGGPSGIAGVSRNLLGTGELTTEALYLITMLVLGVVVAGLRSLRRSRTGRALEAIRTQERTAQACGIDVYQLRLRTFVLGSAVAGLAGGLFAPALRFVSPDFVGLQQSIDFLVMVVIGGLGTGWGVVPGSAIVRGLPETVQGLRDWQLVITGLLTLLVLTRFQRGIAGTIEQLLRPGRATTPPPDDAPADAPADTPADAPATDGPTAADAGATAASAEPPPAPATRGGDGAALLELRGVGRRFGGLAALTDVDLDVRPGELHALVGPNGAGKTTLVNCISGLDRPTSGEVRWAGEPVTHLPPHDRARLGMSRTFQLVGLSSGLTVLENAMLGGYLWTSSGLLRGTAGWARRPEERAVRAAAMETLERLGLGELANLYPSEIAIGQQRLTEVARCLVSRADLLLLDEPAAGLNETETAALGRRLREIVATGTAILLIEHDMGLVMEVSDRVSVLVFGELLTTGSPRQVTTDPRVISSYLGQSAAGHPEREQQP